MSKKLLLSNSASSGSTGGNLVFHYPLTNNEHGNNEVKDASGNRNDGYLTGSYVWQSDCLGFSDASYSGTNLRTPVTPTITNKDFKLEFKIVYMGKGHSVFPTICTTQLQGKYDTGLHCTGVFGSYAYLTFELSGKAIKYSIDKLVNNLKVVLEKKGTNFTVKINDQLVGTQKIIDYKLSSDTLTFGPASMGLEYIKYYEY